MPFTAYRGNVKVKYCCMSLVHCCAWNAMYFGASEAMALVRFCNFAFSSNKKQMANLPSEIDLSFPSGRVSSLAHEIALVAGDGTCMARQLSVHERRRGHPVIQYGPPHPSKPPHKARKLLNSCLLPDFHLFLFFIHCPPLLPS